MPISEELFTELCRKTGFVQLPIKNEHIFLLKTLKRPMTVPKHNDPFDMMLLSQAKYEKLKLLIHDLRFRYYGENCVMSV